MAQKKNLWQRLFSSADDEEMGLSVAERNAIQESLKSGDGLTIQQDNVTARRRRSLSHQSDFSVHSTDCRKQCESTNG